MNPSIPIILLPVNWSLLLISPRSSHHRNIFSYFHGDKSFFLFWQPLLTSVCLFTLMWRFSYSFSIFYLKLVPLPHFSPSSRHPNCRCPSSPPFCYPQLVSVCRWQLSSLPPSAHHKGEPIRARLLLPSHRPPAFNYLSSRPFHTFCTKRGLPPSPRDTLKDYPNSRPVESMSEPHFGSSSKQLLLCQMSFFLSLQDLFNSFSVLPSPRERGCESCWSIERGKKFKIDMCSQLWSGATSACLSLPSLDLLGDSTRDERNHFKTAE